MKKQKQVSITKVDKLSQAYKLEKPVSALEAGKKSEKPEESMTLVEAHAKVLKTVKANSSNKEFLGVPVESVKSEQKNRGLLYKGKKGVK